MLKSKVKTAESIMKLIRKLSVEELDKLDDLIDVYEDELEAAVQETEAETTAEAVEEAVEMPAGEIAAPTEAESSQIVQAQKTADDYDAEIIAYKKEIADKEAEIIKISAELEAVQRKQYKADNSKQNELDKLARIYNS